MNMLFIADTPRHKPEEQEGNYASKVSDRYTKHKRNNTEPVHP